MVAHRPGPGGLRPIVSGMNDVVQHIAKRGWGSNRGGDNGRENHSWADMVLLVDPTCRHSLAAHRAIFIGGIKGAGFMTVRIICQGKGCVSNDFGLLRARITDGKAIANTIGQPIQKRTL